jgi:hypothetical protein
MKTRTDCGLILSAGATGIVTTIIVASLGGITLTVLCPQFMDIEPGTETSSIAVGIAIWIVIWGLSVLIGILAAFRRYNREKCEKDER